MAYWKAICWIQFEANPIVYKWLSSVNKWHYKRGRVGTVTDLKIEKKTKRYNEPNVTCET